MSEDAWKRQRSLQKKYVDVPGIKELTDIIYTIAGKNQLRDRALFAIYYLTGCRVSEITKCPYLRFARYQKDNESWSIIDTWKEPHDFQGVKKKDITFDMIDDKECMYIRTENRKNKNKITKKQPIPIELEQPIVQYVEDYLNTLQEDDVLFPFWPSRATQIINKIGWNVHFIRHIRATHLVTLYDFNEQLLVKFMGWSNSLPAKNYMELSFQRGQNEMSLL